MSRILVKILTVETDTKLALKTFKEGITNTANTKVNTDAQTSRRLKWIEIVGF